MDLPAKAHKKGDGTGGADPQTVEKYREAVGQYGSTVLSVRAICARCGVSYASEKVQPCDQGQICRCHRPAQGERPHHRCRGGRVWTSARMFPSVFERARAGIVHPSRDGPNGKWPSGIAAQHGQIRRGHTAVRLDVREPAIAGPTVRTERLFAGTIHQTALPGTDRKA